MALLPLGSWLQLGTVVGRSPAGDVVTQAADLHADLLVIGGGPGGYTAAFRAADLGRSVVLVDRWERLGGVCLNVGCIPSKALLHAAKVIKDAANFELHGVRFGAPVIRLDALRLWKESVVTRLTGGLEDLARRTQGDNCGWDCPVCQCEHSYR